MKLSDQTRFVIVERETRELWGLDVYHNKTGAKTSFFHAGKHYDKSLNKYVTTKFDDQDKYEIVEVKLVEVGNW